MFLIKKLLTSLIVPPGLFISALLIGALFSRKRKIPTTLLLLSAFLLYLASIAPVANTLLSPLENHYPVPAPEDLQTCEAYIVLGGGVYDGANDLFGKETLSADSTSRLVAAYALYQVVRKPVIVSGGPAYPDEVPESEIARRFLVRLGVRSEDIAVESRSRDTYENALYTGELCSGRGIDRIVLVTSAYHLKRAALLFSRYFKDITPFPADFRISRGPARLRDFFPDIGSLHGTSIALREALGILFYKIKFRGITTGSSKGRRDEGDTAGKNLRAVKF
jgi:uncharacterized SAM-binding protein YcdF (DUF218 family)